MPTADYDAGCRVRSTSTKCPTRKSRTSSSPPISRPENALASRLLFRQFSKSLAKTCKSGSRKALLHLALESRDPPFAALNHVAGDLMVWNDPALAASCARSSVVSGLSRREGGRPMNETTTIGLDIAKQVFQVHGVAVDGTVTVKRQLR